MMKTPSEFEIDQLMHLYDPAKAHEYYVKNRKLKGRKPGGFALGNINTKVRAEKSKDSTDPRTGKTRQQISKNARAKQKKELAVAIQGLQERLNKLEALIKKRAHEGASDDRKSKAKKERAAKESDKPKSAAEKAKAERENKKYKDKHKQEIKSKAKKEAHKSGGSSKSGSDSSSKHSISELHGLAKQVRGQIAVAKQKLAAL